MRTPTAPKLLFRFRAGPKDRPVLAQEPDRCLCVAGASGRAALEAVRVAVDLEVAPAHGRALGGDADVVVAGADALGPGDVVVDASCLDLVADGVESCII